MIVAIPKEVREGERRVAVVPSVVKRLVNAEFEIRVEAGAGEGAFFSDADYEEAGATVATDAAALFRDAEVVVKVGVPADREGTHEVDLLREGGALIGFLNPYGDPHLIQRLAERNVTAFSMELIPRISRAQSMDALSSQAGIAGYKAVLLAAGSLAKFFPMLTTAAGTMKPAKVFIIGAGVAGLQAIATARRLGAVVEAFDIRPASRDEVQSLGAKFVEVELGEETETTGGYAKEVSEDAKKREHEVIAEHVKQSDVVITTAQVPGKRAPVLVTQDMVEGMQPGAILVDLAAEQGGNCELTQANTDVVHHGVTILGVVNLPATMPVHASAMYSKNVSTLLQHLSKDGALTLDFDDHITHDACVTHNGEIRNERIKQALATE
ncbi:Re/Si-specific NAD(P)(+) transhydrogenase subunit alpha [candidate division KSB3 bacterium]|uniref:NAD(P) transhydrogenase subunit alpha part 1 n=1 Tax=candidate division KSB3 bacterium TaxID=2044937 RepID=A0A9D5Q691_9BACT|nr:Re/Si-specific NAD(P)(+) transhydrogenase subunit alpha [candidate division KSB3 bacterium]MBD3324676.1 Re/Si-specific NAD(P)(+) transhydrogenase subunit alpha [candidate division KSB3 bacterium]